MNVGIIQCDSVPDELITEFGNYTDMIKHMFLPIATDLAFQVFDVQRAEYPDNVDDFDFFITTGSKADAYQDVPWISRLIDFVRILDKRHKKLIGICFGHQIIALARHGQVEKSPKGWGVGVATNMIVTRPGWMKTPIDQLNMIVSHQDQITRLPTDALVIASSAFCPYFMLQWGNHFLSVQGHPEWQRDYSRALMNLRREIVGDERVESGLASLAIEPDNNVFTRWALDFVNY